MATLEQQLADAIAAQNALTQAVATYKQQLDAVLANQRASYDAWKAGVRNGYPNINLFNNGTLSRVQADGITPKGFAYWASRLKFTAELKNEGAGGWWTRGSNFVRFTVEVNDGGGMPYGAIWAANQVLRAENNPDIITTRGFEYRIVSAGGGAGLQIGWETGSAGLDMGAVSWKQAALTTPQGRQATAIASVYFPNPSAVGTKLVFDMRNIFVNVGESSQFSLGLSELTEVVI